MRLVAIAAAALATGCVSTPYTYHVESSCSGATPNGPYIASGSGGDRVSGTFCGGMRCGEFVFDAMPNETIAVLPYREDALDGEVRLWWRRESAPASSDRKKLVATFSRGTRVGETRSWWPDGAPRSVNVFERGELVSAAAWSPDGRAAPESTAREVARDDIAADRRLFDALDEVILENPPECPSPVDRDGTR